MIKNNLLLKNSMQGRGDSNSTNKYGMLKEEDNDVLERYLKYQKDNMEPMFISKIIQNQNTGQSMIQSGLKYQ